LNPIFYIVLIIGLISIFTVLMYKQLRQTKVKKIACKTIGSEEHDFAIKNLRSLVQNDPSDHQALYGLAKLLLKDDQPAESLKSAKQLLERNLQGSGVSQIDAVLLCAEAEEACGNLDNAYKNILIAKGLDATNPQVNLKLTLYEYQRGNFQEAFSYAGVLLRLSPTHAQAQLYRGLSAYRLGNTETAIEGLRKAIQLDATNYEAAINLALIYSKFGNVQECANFGNLAHRLSRTGEQRSQALYATGSVYTKSGDVKTGEEKLQEALKETSDPEMSKKILQNLISLAEREKNVSKIVAFLKKFLSLEPNHQGIKQKMEYYSELQANDNLQQFEMLPMSRFPDFCKELVRNIIRVDHIQSVDVNNDGSVDILGNKTTKHEHTIYQFRFLRSSTDIGEMFVRDLYAKMRANSGEKAFMISNSNYTNGAKNFSDTRVVTLIDKQQLIKLLNKSGKNQTL